MSFASSDLRPVRTRALWALAIAVASCVNVAAVLSRRLAPLEKAGILVTSLFAIWPGISALVPCSATYHLSQDSLVAVYSGVRLFKVPYADIEYAGYTAENAFLGGARYLPFGGGILCLITRPGFLVTIDFVRSRVIKAGRFVRVPAKRVLITLDEPQSFVEHLRQRLK